jgi:hypothetical protein
VDWAGVAEGSGSRAASLKILPVRQKVPGHGQSIARKKKPGFQGNRVKEGIG